MVLIDDDEKVDEVGDDDFDDNDDDIECFSADLLFVLRSNEAKLKLLL